MMNKAHRRLAAGSGVAIVSAALAASSWAAGLPTSALTFSGAAGMRDPQIVDADAALLAYSGEASAVMAGGTLQADDLTIEQVLLLLERAEQAAHEQGIGATDDVADAAVELAGLLNTYLAERGTDTSTVSMQDIAGSAARLTRLLNPSGGRFISLGLSRNNPAELAARANVLTGELTNAPMTKALRDLVAQYGTSTAGYHNGQLPGNVLCPLPFAPGHRLRCDAAAALIQLNIEFQRTFGRPIPMTDSYRTLESQIRLSITKPRLAARPGYSNHGWGLAVDLGQPINTGRSAEYLWLIQNAPRYGWQNPDWARLTGSKPEPWHFEFFAGGTGGINGNYSLSMAEYAAAVSAANRAQVGFDYTAASQVASEQAAAGERSLSAEAQDVIDRAIEARRAEEQRRAEEARKAEQDRLAEAATKGDENSAYQTPTNPAVPTQPVGPTTPVVPTTPATPTSPDDTAVPTPPVTPPTPTEPGTAEPTPGGSTDQNTGSTTNPTTDPSDNGPVVSEVPPTTEPAEPTTPPVVVTPSPSPSTPSPSPSTPNRPHPSPVTPSPAPWLPDSPDSSKLPKCSGLAFVSTTKSRTTCLSDSGKRMSFLGWLAATQKPSALPLCSSNKAQADELCVVKMRWNAGKGRWVVVTKLYAPTDASGSGSDRDSDRDYDDDAAEIATTSPSAQPSHSTPSATATPTPSTPSPTTQAPSSNPATSAPTTHAPSPSPTTQAPSTPTQEAPAPAPAAPSPTPEPTHSTPPVEVSTPEPAPAPTSAPAPAPEPPAPAPAPAAPAPAPEPEPPAPVPEPAAEG